MLLVLTEAQRFSIPVVELQVLVRLRAPVTEKGSEFENPGGSLKAPLWLLWLQVQPRLLCELQRGGPGEGPGRPLLEVQWDVAGALVAQQVVGEAHGGEVDLLQQTGQGDTGYTPVAQPDGGGRGLAAVGGA